MRNSFLLQRKFETKFLLELERKWIKREKAKLMHRKRLGVWMVQFSMSKTRCFRIFRLWIGENEAQVDIKEYERDIAATWLEGFTTLSILSVVRKIVRAKKCYRLKRNLKVEFKIDIDCEIYKASRFLRKVVYA